MTDYSIYLTESCYLQNFCLHLVHLMLAYWQMSHFCYLVWSKLKVWMNVVPILSCFYPVFVKLAFKPDTVCSYSLLGPDETCVSLPFKKNEILTGCFQTMLQLYSWALSHQNQRNVKLWMSIKVLHRLHNANIITQFKKLPENCPEKSFWRTLCSWNVSLHGRNCVCVFTYKDHSADPGAFPPELRHLIQLIQLVDPLQHHLVTIACTGDQALEPNTHRSQVRSDTLTPRLMQR